MAGKRKTTKTEPAPVPPLVIEDLAEASAAPQGRTVSLKAIRQCGLDFLDDMETAARLGMHRTVWKKLKRDERVKDAFEAGKALGRAILKAQSRKLMLIHGSAGVSMAIYMRKQYLGERETSQVNLKTSGKQTVEHDHRFTLDLTKCTDAEIEFLRLIFARQTTLAPPIDVGDRGGDRPA